MKTETVFNIKPLDFLFEVSDPFLFCAHHRDQYPAGTTEMGPPAASLRGRNIGQDFTLREGWRMYHGETVPGFPEHPHRGFETVTIVLEGFVDHSDSHGQAGRYGMGDVQWMTAGSGLQHSEMFPLLSQDKENPAELFQVWLNLPQSRKMADPFFKMLWSEKIPVVTIPDESGRSATVRVIAGNLGEISAVAPAPDSWAADPDNHVAIWLIRMEPGVKWTLPAAHQEVNRTLYFYRGESLRIGEQTILADHSFSVTTREVIIENGSGEGFLLLLQGKPINEPVVQYGPFVMNSQPEIRQAVADYQSTGFGGWPWSRRDPVHPLTGGRFAKYSDGTVETPSF